MPPSLNQSSKSTFKKAVGSPITIRCSAVGNPKPKIGLYHGSVLRHHVANGKPLIYTNPSLKASDFGCYQCIAKNAFGFDQRNITVIREGTFIIYVRNALSFADYCTVK